MEKHFTTLDAAKIAGWITVTRAKVITTELRKKDGYTMLDTSGMSARGWDYAVCDAHGAIVAATVDIHLSDEKNSIGDIGVSQPMFDGTAVVFHHGILMQYVHGMYRGMTTDNINVQVKSAMFHKMVTSDGTDATKQPDYWHTKWNEYGASESEHVIWTDYGIRLTPLESK